MIFTEKQAGRKIIKCLLIDGQEATQMFSQRNNPYCDLLSKIDKAKVIQKIRIKNTLT